MTPVAPPRTRAEAERLLAAVTVHRDALLDVLEALLTEEDAITRERLRWRVRQVVADARFLQQLEKTT